MEEPHHQPDENDALPYAVKQDAGKGSDYIISSCEEAYRDEPDAEA